LRYDFVLLLLFVWQTTRISTLAALAGKSATCCLHVFVYHFFILAAKPFALLGLDSLAMFVLFWKAA
jgi:hypothetical protein